MTIPVLLIYFVRKRQDAPFRSLFWFFGAFIVLCGTTHFMEAYTFFQPLYRLSALVKLLTALVSAVTVFVLIPVLPRALAMRFPQELEHEIQERKKVETKLLNLNETLEQRVQERTTELQQRADELEKLNQVLVRSNQELDDFAYIASHDLKEPLRGISNYAHFLLEDYHEKLDEEGKRKLKTLQDLSQRMSNQIESLHHYSQVGTVEMGFTPTDLNAIVREVLESLQIVLEESPAVVRILEPLPTVPCDRVRVREVFYNLITNALKYNTKSERLVEIGVTKSASTRGVVLFVRDNGIGIPEKHKSNIFRMFRRLHSRDKFGGGTGVGLTLAKKIIERHGGCIWIESVMDQGTTFYFSLNSEEAHHVRIPE